MARLTFPRIDVGSAAKTDGGVEAAAPVVQAIRIAFGVGTGRDAPPSADAFRPSYVLNIPLFSFGGLDPDGVYEFDGAGLLATLQSKATKRHWGARLEVELEQAAAAVGRVDIVVEGPDGAPAPVAIGSPEGETLPGGGRRLVFGSTVITDPAGLSKVQGEYRVRQLDGDPAGDARIVRVGLDRFEFQ